MQQLARYVLPAEKELNMVFHFELMDVDCGGDERDTPLIWRKWTLTEFKAIVSKWQRFLRKEGFWNRYVQTHCDTSNPICVLMLLSLDCDWPLRIKHLYRKSWPAALGFPLCQWRSDTQSACGKDVSYIPDYTNWNIVCISRRRVRNGECTPKLGYWGIQGCCYAELLQSVRTGCFFVHGRCCLKP